MGGRAGDVWIKTVARGALGAHQTEWGGNGGDNDVM